MRAVLILILISALGAIAPVAADAQDSSTTLAAVISAFLADSGVRTRGLPWTTGSGTAIKWESTAPVRNPDTWMNNPALTLARIGAVPVPVGDKVRDLNVRVYGSQAGIQRVSFSFPWDSNFEGGDLRDSVSATLEAGNLSLAPLKCEKEREGYTYGNLAFIVTAPRKAASALWWTWNCAADGSCGFDMNILYRRADLAQVECAGA
jgi:hypothetical protein